MIEKNIKQDNIDSTLKSLVSEVKVKSVRKRVLKPEIIARRKNVYELFLRGENQDHIANIYKISTRQIQRDLVEARKLLSENWDKQTLLGKMVDYDEKARVRVRKLHIIILDPKSSTDEVVRAIKELRREDVESIKREQLAGILPKEASPLISIDAKSDGGDAENKVMINIIAPKGVKKLDIKKSKEDEENEI